jgi:hypothetical protein
MSIMNMYDTKTIHCSGCGRFIGEIDYDSMVTLPKCGQCVDQIFQGTRKLQVSADNHHPGALVI